MINIIRIGQNIDNITIAGLKAIENSQVIMGKKESLNQIKDLLESKEIIEIQNNEIIENCEIAIEKSHESQISIIDAGDAGVYGLANAFFYILPKYSNIEVKIYPGVCKINYAADLLGAPLDDFATINLNNDFIPISEIENKVKSALKANFTLVVINPINEDNKEPFIRFKKLLLDLRGEKCFIGIVNSNEEISIVRLKNFKENLLNKNSILVVGNELTYKKKGKLISPANYAIKTDIHELSVDYFEKFINSEIVHGSNKDCEYYPCHYDGQMCDFCYCPFYPCGDSSTGGFWIKDKNIWSCENCLFIHDKEKVNCLRKPLEEIINNPEDLKNKKQLLLKLRRACLLGNNPYDL